MKYLAIDVGKVRTGLAVTDSKGIVAMPYKTIKEKHIKKLVQKIIKIINEIHAEKILVGYPLRKNNSKSDSTTYVESFVKELKKFIDDDSIETVDERYSTCFADTILKDTGLNRKQRSQKVDEISALVILKNYLQQY